MFAANNGGRPSWYGQGKLYELKIFMKNATTGEFDLLRHYIPCTKDNRAGLYDKVNGTISFSAGSTNFIAGSVTNAPPQDPEGRVIEDPGVVEWLSNNGFTQANIDTLGNDSDATDKLYECFLLNCDFTAQNAGGALSLTAFAVSNGDVSVMVQLTRKAPLGGTINGHLYLYGARMTSPQASATPRLPTSPSTSARTIRPSTPPSPTIWSRRPRPPPSA